MVSRAGIGTLSHLNALSFKLKVLILKLQRKIKSKVIGFMLKR